MKRTKLKDRILPKYSRGEEIFNMASHIAGGGLGIAIAVISIVKAFLNHDAYQITGAFIYGFSMILLYTMSSLYHGITNSTAKKVFQIIDHCSIFILIAGTYSPIALSSIRENNAVIGWGLFAFVWTMSILGVVLNSIDLKKYRLFSYTCYIAVGWCVLFVIKPTIEAVTYPGFWWLLSGGIAYTIGAVFYAFAAKGKVKYIHSAFHLFVILGTLLQAVCVIFYVLI